MNLVTAAVKYGSVSCALVLMLSLCEPASAIAPFNDDCADATPVFEGPIAFTTMDATTDGPADPAACGAADDGLITADIWYCYTASCTGTVEFNLCGSSFDTKIAVYEGCGCPGALSTAARCDDDACGLPPIQSRIAMNVTQGASYLVRVGGGTTPDGTPIRGDGTLDIRNMHCDGEPPDLIFNAAAADPFITTATFGPTDCVVEQGCAQAGERKLLRFTQETWNLGPGDLVIGRTDASNPLLHFSDCDGRYLFEGLAAYRLVGPEGVVATGRKSGRNILDSYRHDLTANVSQRYGRTLQGIQAGWADVYGPGQICQWIDITDVPAGAYVLEVEVNPDRRVLETDYDNNIASIPIYIPCDAMPELIGVGPDLGVHDPRGPDERDRFIWPQSMNVPVTQIDVQMSVAVQLVEPQSWCTTTPGVAAAPAVVDLVAGVGGWHTVRFDGPVPAGAWTTVVLSVVNACGEEADICFHLAHLPGDVDHSGATTAADATAFGDLFSDGAIQRIDLNGDGQTSLADANTFGQIWHGTSGEAHPDGAGWAGLSLATDPPCKCP